MARWRDDSVEQMTLNCEVAFSVASTKNATSPQSRAGSFLISPRFVLALAGIRRLVMQIKATEKYGLMLFAFIVFGLNTQSESSLLTTYWSGFNSSLR